MSRARLVFKFIFAWRDYIVTVVTPLLLTFFFIWDGTEYQKPARCTYVLLILVIFWTTECIPIAATALLPMFLYPLLRITQAKDLAPKYMSEVNMAFIGSYIMVLAFEHVGLHKRVALRILLTVGAQPRWLLFGIMMSACFLSMFTNNTMSCALHLPIVKGIIDELREVSKKQPGGDKTANENHENGESKTIAQEENKASGQDIEMQPMKAQENPLEEVALLPTNGETSVAPLEHEVEQQEQHTEVLSSKVIDGIEKMLLISAAYAASIGGLVTLIGTPTNLIMKERAEKVYEPYAQNCTQPVTFTSWLVLGVPVGYSFLILAWFYLQFFFLGPRYVFKVWITRPISRCFHRNAAKTNQGKDAATIRAERITAVIKQLYAQLEPMGYPQYVVLVHCIVLVVLLITRQMSAGSGGTDGGIGWDMLSPKYTKESTAAILVSSFLFIFPASLPKFKLSGDIKVPKALLTWQYVDREFPFGVCLLLGGGMAAAAGAQDSGLPNLIAPVIGDLMKTMSLGLCVLLTSIVVSILTEFMSNIACVTLISPIMENLARDMNVNPLLFLFPTALASSFAFMLPVATPPNALVFSTNRLKIIDMVLCGMGMKFGILIVTLASITFGNSYFSLDKPPCSG